MQDTFKALKDKYAHLEFSILPLSSALKDNETKRLDSEYFKKEYLENEELLKRFDCQVLGEICNKICNGSTPENGDFEKEGIPFFRSQDFNLLDTEPNQCITAAFHNTLLRSKVKYKDILIAIIGATLGKIGFVGENIAEANINQNIAKISINNNKFNPYFVAIFLDTYYGQYQIFRLATQTAQEYLNNIQVAKIKIPLFDSSFQKDIEKIVKDSHHKLEQSKVLYKEAESLLYESLGMPNSLNHCVDTATQERTTEALKLKFPHLNFSIKPLSLSLQKSGRLDSEYYQSKYENIEALIESYKGGFCRLKDIGFFTNGSFIPESLYTQKAKRAYIRIKELSFNAPINLQDCIYIDDSFKASNETIVRQNDFVIATIGNTIGKVNLIPKELDGSFISNNTSRFRLNNTSIMPEFLELLLRNLIVQEQIQRDFTQTAQPKIDNNSLENILIPLLDSQIQEQIASKLKLSCFKKGGKRAFKSSKKQGRECHREQTLIFKEQNLY